ncbi:MAG: ABC-F family ATP-binding cassette domain-containing protein [Bilifractor sp.]|jgi:ATPase subunit of ABC transporter with duplicated ATPase domains|nr:ATP-binding cassette domain-containing protein [Lachnospiraceae bacterium]
MIAASNISLRVGKKALFENVNIKFTDGGCYGIIGANGAGKSTFLKILSGQLEPTTGEITITPGQRLSFLEQDHFKYDDQTVMDTVIQGNQHLYDIMKEKDALYAKEDFTDADGIRASELEGEFAEMDGWNAETDAETLLNGLGVSTDLHYAVMGTLDGPIKVKVLLARALFGNPDILLLDEPTNHLDLDAINWLEEFLINFENTVIVVSHDRYFLNKVCTNIADIDYGKITLYAGNYDFWFESSALMLRQRKEANKKKEEQIKELKEFIAKFSANASKSKQATSRKKALDKIVLDEIKPSSRKYPYIDFKPNREIGNEVLEVHDLTKTVDGEKVLDHVSFTLRREDKVAFVGSNEKAASTLFQIISGREEPDEGYYKWGITTSQAYFPKEYNEEFDSDLTITDWLTQYSEIKDVTYVRGFLGRMLFAGEDGVKKVRVLSGGEKVRCMLSKMMISGANVLILDQPTNHLDMESIQALNNGLIKFPGVELFTCHDHQFVETTANRIMEFMPDGTMIDKVTTYDEYLASDEAARKRTVYTSTEEDN